MFPNTGDTLLYERVRLCVCLCVCVCACEREKDVLYLSGCWIISAFEIHSRFHSLIMTVFAHDRAGKREGEN